MTLDEIQLPDDLDWVNEFNWTPVVRKQKYGVGGALFITDSIKQTGRPVHLQSEQDTCWVKRPLIQSLILLTREPGKIMTLTLSDNREFQVMFDHASGAIEAERILKGSYFSDDDYYQIKSIKFIEVTNG